MQQIYGIIELDPPIICSKEVLGSSEPVIVSGVRGRLELPHAPDWSAPSENPTRDPLRPPEIARTWKQGDRLMIWGFPESYPNCVSRVERMLLLFELPEQEVSASATLIYRGYSKWWSLFNDYFELITRQRRSRNQRIDVDAHNFDLFRWGSDNQPERPYTKEPIKIEIRMLSDDLLLTPAQLTKITSLASTLTELAIELKVQLEAYRALGVSDFRKAIIETAVAAELALTNAVRARFQSDGIAYGDKLLEKFRMLGGRLELSRIVNIPLPQLDFSAQLVEPRNQVIHQADFANEERATQAVKATDELLRLLWPSLWART